MNNDDKLPKYVFLIICLTVTFLLTAGLLYFIDYQKGPVANPIGKFNDATMDETIDNNADNGILPAAYGSEKMYVNWTIDDPPLGDEPVVVRIHDNSTNRIIHCTHTTMCPYPTDAMHNMLMQIELYDAHTIVNLVLSPANITVFNGTIGQLHN